ncbi:MAG TPA: 2-amino-4-hydroxy-6-hydroxymethyldihydropteridine diphosphokinase [Bryobacteraceae bacterium]|nr:2-amino-4-hydroxy-6-hydroxymethyldihydropteridine diphosphokinase [Bryobacteraceae bacterium]
MKIYLGLGSNLGDRESNLRQALAGLAPAVRALRVSPVYETEPLDYLDQGWFLNLAVEAETALTPMELLTHIAGIEEAMGRVRAIPKGPRVIDIDILLYGDSVIETPKLQVPHPGMAGRRFVLQPLADLAPGLRHPGTKKTIREMLEEAPELAIKLQPSPEGERK